MPLLLLLLFTLATIAKAVFSGRIQFYRDINLNHHLGSLKFNKANRCFNLDCDDLNDAISSVKWWGLPAKATYKSGIPARMAFYADLNCKGESRSYPTKWEGIMAFSARSFNDVISSIMLLQTSTKVEKGYINVCEVAESGMWSATNSSILYEVDNTTDNYN
ncbi:hypothetical protein PHYBOEH_008240 [Phytophthora boehmeriae]|uniref:Ecp2 effector protein domain-containing protein n=1 Tax=Phytophthora boehmeriae TaxID=109152 RepID=A0A8T1W5L0_9STRA|nr:hypothetical protein PHYBOEH_008240 [Phytophthora boehmeriae]